MPFIMAFQAVVWVTAISATQGLPKQQRFTQQADDLQS